MITIKLYPRKDTSDDKNQRLFASFANSLVHVVCVFSPSSFDRSIHRRSPLYFHRVTEQRIKEVLGLINMRQVNIQAMLLTGGFLYNQVLQVPSSLSPSTTLSGISNCLSKGRRLCVLWKPFSFFFLNPLHLKKTKNLFLQKWEFSESFWDVSKSFSELLLSVEPSCAKNLGRWFRKPA